MRPSAASWRPSKRVPLPPAFFLRDVETVARLLLGKGLFVRRGGDEMLVRLVETEAYSQDDPASHSFRGETSRCRSMFLAGGSCYVYRSYGIHFCVNVVTGPPGRGEAVLLRAAEPLLGHGAMARRRGLPWDGSPESLAPTALNGPAKLTQALGVGPRHDGLTFDRDDLKLVDLGDPPGPDEVIAARRIGISKARDLHRRFHLRGSAWVSRKG